MEKEIRNRYSDVILTAVQQRYAIHPEQIRLLDGFESFMYEFTQDGRDYILRVSHSIRRTPELIYGEVDWINYLAAHGAGVAQAVSSKQGNLVELIEDGHGGHFLATAFVKAKGGSPRQMNQWDERLFEEYGRLLGHLHHLTKSYQPADPAWKRFDWDDPSMLFVEQWLPAGEEKILERYRTIVTHLRDLPQDRESYGLIHQDAHSGNFFVDEAYQITLFDFDDCVYGHFVYDLAMVLFYAVTNRDDADEFGLHFWRHFWPGYQQENYLDPAWLREIPYFLKLREFDLYAALHRSYDDVNNIPHAWPAKFMHGRKQRLENDTPYLMLDFDSLDSNIG
jgi:amicoumacin kinase